MTSFTQPYSAKLFFQQVQLLSFITLIEDPENLESATRTPTGISAEITGGQTEITSATDVASIGAEQGE